MKIYDVFCNMEATKLTEMLQDAKQVKVYDPANDYVITGLMFGNDEMYDGEYYYQYLAVRYEIYICYYDVAYYSDQAIADLDLSEPAKVVFYDHYIAVPDYFKCNDDEDIVALVKNKVKMLVRASGMTQTKFAEYFGIPLRTLQEWIALHRTPPEYVVNLIEDKLKADKLI